MTMLNGRIVEQHARYSRGESGMVWKTAGGSIQGEPVALADLPDYARDFLIMGQTPKADALADAPIVAPAGFEAVDAGPCKLFLSLNDAPRRRASNWRGNCVRGFADGEGFTEIVYANQRIASKVKALRGRLIWPWPPAELYVIHDGGQTGVYSQAERKWSPVARDQVPQWARGFLDQHPVVVAAVQPPPRQSTEAAEEEQWQRQMEERRRRAREDREEEAQRERESNERMQAFGAMIAQSRRQNEEVQARRQAQLADTARLNEQYRQQRAAQDRQWQQENARRQQDLAERQRASEQYERQRREQVAQAQANRCAGLPSANHRPWPEAQRNGAQKCACEGGSWRQVSNRPSFSCFMNGEATWGCGPDPQFGSQCGQK